MNSRITHDGEQIDHRTCRSICDAIGERLQQTLRPDTSRLSSHLQHLMDELRRRDSEGRWKSNQPTLFSGWGDFGSDIPPIKRLRFAAAPVTSPHAFDDRYI